MKSPLKSKTVVFNVAAAFAAAWNVLTGYLPAEWVSAAAPTIALINIYLRFKTTEPIVRDPYDVGGAA